MPWQSLLAYSLGAAWIWAALTPAVLWLTRRRHVCGRAAGSQRPDSSP